MIRVSWRKSLILLGVLLAALSVVVCTLFVADIKEYATSSALLKELSTLEDVAYRSYFTDHIDDIYTARGINGMVDLVVDAYEEGRINMFECHSLAHDLGHYGGYPDHFSNIEDYLSKRNLDFCGSGFLHGVEGQLANNPYPQNAEYLYSFCLDAMPLDPFYKGCYHGAGHAFMENTGDPLRALLECDTLITDDQYVQDVGNCYRGVFSEHADELHMSGKSKTDLLQFCMDLPEAFHGYCAEELNGLHVSHDTSDEEMETTLRLCTEGGYSDVITYGCTKSVAGVIADALLGRGEEVVIPEIVHTFSESAERGYINGTVGVFVKSGRERTQENLNSFCASLKTSEKQHYCSMLGGM